MVNEKLRMGCWVTRSGLSNTFPFPRFSGLRFEEKSRKSRCEIIGCHTIYINSYLNNINDYDQRGDEIETTNSFSYQTNNKLKE